MRSVLSHPSWLLRLFHWLTRRKPAASEQAAVTTEIERETRRTL